MLNIYFKNFINKFFFYDAQLVFGVEKLSFKNKLFKSFILLVYFLFFISLINLFVITSASCDPLVTVTDPESLKAGQKCSLELKEAAEKLNQIQIKIITLPLILQQSAAYQQELHACKIAFIEAQLNYAHWLVKAELYGWVDISKIDAVNYKKYLQDCILIKDINAIEFSQICDRFKHIIAQGEGAHLQKLHHIAYDYVIHHKSPGIFYSSSNLYNNFYEGQVIKLELRQIIRVFNANPGILKACMAT